MLQSMGSQRVRHDLVTEQQQSCIRAQAERDQMANIHWIMEKAREFQKNIYFCLIDYAKAFDCVDLCGSQETVENSERDGNTRPPDLPLEKFVCRSGSNS